MSTTQLKSVRDNSLVYFKADCKLKDSHKVLGRVRHSPENVVLEDVSGKRFVLHASERVFVSSNLNL